MSVLAADTDTGRPAYGGGTGTQSDLWLISSVEDLQTLEIAINIDAAADIDADADGGGQGIAGNYYGYYFKQTCDLDLSNIENWEPIGYSGSCYTAGLFGWVTFGSVSNVHVIQAGIKATGNRNYSYVGGIAAVVYGSSIQTCSVPNSKIESIRTDNNNCAGGIAGYSTGGTFQNCAAESNTVKTMAYGGGFVGEVDNDYGVGTSSFTNCYVANTIVIASTENMQGVSFAGGFAGEMTVSSLTLANCFVYNTSTGIGEDSAPLTLKATGVFAGNLWKNSTMSPINATDIAV